MLTGKVAVITGASRGIGRATAIELAKRGAFVIVNYRGSEAAALETVAEIKSAGGDAVCMAWDVSDYAECEKNKCRGKDLYGFYHGGSCKNAGFSERNGIKGEKIEK